MKQIIRKFGGSGGRSPVTSLYLISIGRDGTLSNRYTVL